MLRGTLAAFVQPPAPPWPLPGPSCRVDFWLGQAAGVATAAAIAALCQFTLEPERDFLRRHQVGSRLQQIDYEPVAAITLTFEVRLVTVCDHFHLGELVLELGDLCLERINDRPVTRR